MEFHHISVLMEETLSALITNPDGIYVDCTLGGSGHAKRIVDKLSSKGRFIGIDQDPAAIAVGKARLADAICRVDIVNNNFSNISKILDELNIDYVDGILFDLGVSSHQLDVAERGFSYMQDASLDMRMNPNQDLSAFDIVNKYSEDELTRIIFEYGEERWAKRIAKLIVEARQVTTINTTGQLVDVIKRAIPAAARREGPHPAKRTFQAIRIEVNNELDMLKDVFTDAVTRLRKHGRLCIITFHSLEDRIAKKTLQNLAKTCVCPPRIPICICKQEAQLKLIGKPIAPSENETNENPRARSAKLRVAEKL
ncbi:16S rRNA (cytosine(1402)-N(4))-methyltransferase RsmH [Dendrosporobacter sp. 1207_IL3150]|uniref:16S rRNA (cytosine(1402)-N(4))-methyltransferase RsmH n=1 Tax=Dendrosporobacter sp. 1207_IL3150 TaxID=3084054 RepID=UPI002FD92E0B